MIDSQQASEALADINEMTRRVRQSRIYNLASLMLIMWGVLVFAGYLGSFLWPRYAGYFWIVLNAAGVAGSFAISAFGYRRTGIRTFDIRMLIAFLLFFAFGFLCTSVLGRPSVARRNWSPLRSTDRPLPRIMTEIGRPPGLSLKAIETNGPMSTP